MSKYLKIGLVVLMAAAVGGSAYAQVYPTVQLSSFDPVTGSYVYTITCLATSTYAFGYFQIDTHVANAPPTGPWSIQGPFVGGVNQLWPIGYSRWDPVNGLDAAVWDPWSRGQVIPPRTAWQGTFVLIVPESQPELGRAATKDGQIGSYKIHDLPVPGPKPLPHPPVTTISLDGALGDNDWYTSPVMVTLSATDPRNDVSVTWYKLDDLDWQLYQQPFDVTTNGVHNLLAYSEDAAGYVEDPPVSVTFRIDITGPTVTGAPTTQPNANGWYNADVLVEYTAVDGTSSHGLQIDYSAVDNISGLAEPQPADPGTTINFSQYVTGEGAGLSDTAYATDKAGNVGSCTVSGLNIDKSSPTLAVISAPTGNCNLISYETAVVRFTAVDTVSGISGLPWAVVSINPTDGWAQPSVQTLTAVSVGAGVYEVSFALQVPGNYAIALFAKDLAGNVGQIATPVSFGAGGFTVEWLPPISLMDIYVMQDGSTVPVKFQLKDPCNNNVYVNTYIYTLKVINTANQVMMTAQAPLADPSTGSYHVNVKTKDANNVDWPLGDYTVVIEGPGIWDIVSGPYRSRYGLQLVDKAVAKGKGRR